MLYRLIALDVDGTLLNDDHVLTEATKQAVREVYRSGASIVLCTGRSPSNTFPIMEELGLEGTLITHNGAATVQSRDRKVIHQFSYPMQDVLSLIAYCRETGIHYETNNLYDVYIDSVTADAAAMYEKFGLSPKRVENIAELTEPVMKFTLYGETELMDRVERDWASIGCPLTPIRSGVKFIDVMHPEATKGNALRDLAGFRNIPREQVLAIGNYYNDLDMIRFAGLGIAMDNSPEPVKEGADAVAPPNNEDGVAAVLRRYVLGGSLA